MQLKKHKPDKMNEAQQLKLFWLRSLNGDVRSFSMIHSRLYPELFRYLLKMTKDDALSDDLLQELFIKMWERKSNLGVITNIKVYFYRAARSLALNYFKSNKIQWVRDLENMKLDVILSPEEMLMDREVNIEMKTMLDLAVGLLPVRQQEMIKLKFYEGLNYSQIAEQTGIKHQSVINHIHRAVTQLRSELAVEKSPVSLN